MIRLADGRYLDLVTGAFMAAVYAAIALPCYAIVRAWQRWR